MGKTFSDVILVVKEPIDPGSLPSKYCKLKKMLSTKTYLEWPQQVSQQAFFWVQLRSVLGKPAASQEDRHSIKSRTSSVGGISLIGPLIEQPAAAAAATPNTEPKNETHKAELSNQRSIPLVAF